MKEWRWVYKRRDKRPKVTLSLGAPQLRTQEMNRTGWWYQTLLYNITFSSDKWPERENERLTEKTQWWKGTEGGKGRKISARISSMPSTAKWGLSGEFDRIQLKAVVDKMMMNCSRAAERWFASDSTHQFLPKHLEGKEGKWAEGEEGHHFWGREGEAAFVCWGERERWITEGVSVASHSGVKSVSDAPVEPSSC